jgi:hypothetical protein
MFGNPKRGISNFGMLADSELVLMSDMVMVLSCPFLGRFLDGVSGRPLAVRMSCILRPVCDPIAMSLGRAKPVGFCDLLPST